MPTTDDNREPAIHPADRLPGRRLVAVIPHPDDEVFVAGLLATAARRGAEVGVVCATRGERGAGPAGTTPDELAAIRTGELEASCRILGARPPVWLDRPDGSVPEADAARARADIRAALEPARPDAVIALGDDGGYGHRDHVALAELVLSASAALSAAPRVLFAAFPRGAFESTWRALRQLSPSPIDPRLGAADLGTSRDAVDLVVALNGAARAKRAACAAHQSQLPDGDPDRFVTPGLLAALSREEWYSLAAGAPLG